MQLPEHSCQKRSSRADRLDQFLSRANPPLLQMESKTFPRVPQFLFVEIVSQCIASELGNCKGVLFAEAGCFFDKLFRQTYRNRFTSHNPYCVIIIHILSLSVVSPPKLSPRFTLPSFFVIPAKTEIQFRRAQSFNFANRYRATFRKKSIFSLTLKQESLLTLEFLVGIEKKNIRFRILHPAFFLIYYFYNLLHFHRWNNPNSVVDLQFKGYQRHFYCLCAFICDSKPKRHNFRLYTFLSASNFTSTS